MAYRRATCDTAAFRSGLLAFFGIETDYPRFYCNVSAMLKRVKLDTLEFDDWLISKHGDYPEEQSTRDRVEREYGDEAVAFILRFL